MAATLPNVNIEKLALAPNNLLFVELNDLQIAALDARTLVEKFRFGEEFR